MNTPATQPNDDQLRNGHLGRAIDGSTVIAVEQAEASHPHPRFGGRMVPYRHVSKVLLEDGREFYACDGGTDGTHCGRISDNPKSIASHRAGKHRNDGQPIPASMYPEAVIKRVLVEAERARRSGVRGFLEAAAQAMNKSGIPTVHGKPWTAGAVHHLRQAHKGRVPIRVTTPRAKPQPARARRAKAEASLKGGDNAAVSRIVAWLDQAEKVAAWLSEATEIRWLVRELQEQADPEVVAKAAKWDQVKGLLGQS
jgi:hypothetical protein